MVLLEGKDLSFDVFSLLPLSQFRRKGDVFRRENIVKIVLNRKLYIQ